MRWSSGRWRVRTSSSRSARSCRSDSAAGPAGGIAPIRHADVSTGARIISAVRAYLRMIDDPWDDGSRTTDEIIRELQEDDERSTIRRCWNGLWRRRSIRSSRSACGCGRVRAGSRSASLW